MNDMNDIFGGLSAPETDDFEAQIQRDRQIKQQQEAMDEASANLETLQHVWLYDAEADSKQKVDGHSRFFVYGTPAMRSGDSGLTVYGRDYARELAALKQNARLADEPMGLAEAMVQDVQDETRRTTYANELNALKASGKDTRDSYYNFIGKMVRDGVTQQHSAYTQKVKELEQRQEELNRQMDEALLNPFVGTAISADFEQDVKDAGLQGDSLDKAREALRTMGFNGLATNNGTEKVIRKDALRRAAALVEGDEDAEALLVRGIALQAHRATVEGDVGVISSLVEAMAGVVANTADYVVGGELEQDLEDKVVDYQLAHDIASEGDVRSRREERAAFDEEQVRLASFSGKVKGAVEQGRTMADEEGNSGFFGAHGRAFGQTVGGVAPWLVRGWWGVAAKGAAYLDMRGNALERTVAEAEEAGRADSAQILRASRNRALGEAVGMSVGGAVLRGGLKMVPVVGTAAGRGVSALGLDKAIARGGVTGALANYGLGGGAAAVDLGVVLPTATALSTGGLNLIDEQMGVLDPAYSRAWEDYKAHFEQLTDPRALTDFGVNVAFFGALSMGAREKAANIMAEMTKEGVTLAEYKKFGGREEDFDRAKREHPLDPAAFTKEINNALLKEAENNPVECLNRALDALKVEVSEENAQAALEDKAARAVLLEKCGVWAEPAENGRVKIWTEARRGEDGRVERGEKVTEVDADVAQRYLGRVAGDGLRQMADYLRSLLAKRAVRDRFMEQEGAREDLLARPMTLADFEAEAKKAEAKIAELTGGDEGKLAAARAMIVPEINAEVPLGALIETARDFKARMENAAATGEVEEGKRPSTAAFVVTVPMPDGSTRSVLRRTVEASLENVLEELGEESRRNYRRIKGEEYSDTAMGRDLLELRDWLRSKKQHEEAGHSFFEVGEELEMMLRRNEPVMGEHARELDHAVTEAFSRLFDSGLVMDAMEGKVDLPVWVARMMSAAAVAGQKAERIQAVGKALQDALHHSDAAFSKKVGEMYNRHREMMSDIFRKWNDPQETDFLDALDAVTRERNELDARLGRGVANPPRVTEEMIEQMHAEEQAHAEEVKETEQEQQEHEQEAVGDMADKPGNEGKTAEELGRERVETYADERETETKNAVNAVEDADFSNGYCVVISADGFADVRSGMVPVEKIGLSADVPQFKRGADAKTGVVHPLAGLYRPDHDPIRVWRRADGRLEVISGRHRLDYARRNGATRIMCYVYGESETRNARWARTFDLEQNIRDNQASPLEVALYVRGENAHGRPLADEEIRAAGIDRKGSRGEAGVMLGRFADEEIITALKNGFSLDDALRVVHFCPGDRDVQREGLRVMRGQPDETGAYNNPGSITEARRVMARFLEVKKMQAEYQGNGSQGDLFGELGFGGNLMDDEFNRFFGKYQTRRLKEISEERSFLNNLVGKKVSAAMAEKYGIDLNDVAGSLKKKLEQLSMDYERWKNPAQHADLMEEMRGAFREENAGQDWMDFGGTAAKEPMPEDGATAHFSAKTIDSNDLIPFSPSRIINDFQRLESVDNGLVPRITGDLKADVSKLRDDAQTAIKGIKSEFFSGGHKGYVSFVKQTPDEEHLIAAIHINDIMSCAIELCSTSRKSTYTKGKLYLSRFYLNNECFHALIAAEKEAGKHYFRNLYVCKDSDIETRNPETQGFLSGTSLIGKPQNLARGKMMVAEAVHFVKSLIIEKQKYVNEGLSLNRPEQLDSWIIMQMPEVKAFLTDSENLLDYGMPQIQYRGLKEPYRDKQNAVLTWVASDIAVSLKHARRKDGSIGEIDRYVISAKKWLTLPGNRNSKVKSLTFFSKVKEAIGIDIIDKKDADKLDELGKKFDARYNGKAVEAYRLWDKAAQELVDIAKHYGYDSFRASEDGTWTLGLFSPSQAKSITRNIGTFDRAETHAHFSLGGEKSAVFGEYDAQGLTYVDPADGKKKFCIDTRGVRLSNGFTPGELSSIAPGGHKDTSLKSMVAFPELWRAYPELGNMRVRLMRPKNGSPGYYGFYDPEGGAEGQYICVNVTAVLAAKNPVTELLDTLLHEAQHAIQAHEGHSNGAGSMGQKGAQRYLGRAIQQRKQLGLDDEWAKANYDFMNKLLARVNRGDKMAIESVYWLSHGEQEARFAGAGYGEGASEAGMNPMTSLARMRGVGVRPDAESWMTVPLSRDITELGGVTFGNAGSHAGVMQSRLVPVGDFYTDRKEFQIREAMTRRTRELNKLATRGERGSTDFLLEALQVANTAVNMLPNGYRFGLEPYQMWLAEFSKLAGTGNIFAAANVVPMAFWQKIMRMSFENQAEGLLTQGAIPRRELEFWLNDKEAMEMLDRASDIVNKERAAVEHDLAGERPDATDKEATAKFEQRLLQELNNRLKANAELPKLEEGLIKKLGEMKIERVLARLLERVHLKFDEYRKDRTLGRIRRVVDSVYPTPGKDGKPQKGKMTADHYRKLDSYMRLMEMKRGEFDLWMNEHYPEGGEARWEDEPLDKLVTVPLYDRHGKRELKEFTVAEVNTFASYERMSAERAEAVAKAFGEFIATGRNAWDNAQEKLRQRTAACCEPLLRMTGVLSENEMSQFRKEQGLGKGFAFGGNFNVFAAGDNDVQFFDALRGVKGLAWAGDIAQRLAKADANHNFDNTETQRRLFKVLQGVGCKSTVDAADFVLDAKTERDTGIVLVEQEPDFYERESAVFRRQFLGLLQRKVDKKNFRPVSFYHALRVLTEQLGVTPDMRVFVEGERKPQGMTEAAWQEARFLVGLEREAMDKFGSVGSDGGREAERGAFYASVFTAAERERLADARKRIPERVAKARTEWQAARTESKSELAEQAEAEEAQNRKSLVLSKAQAAYLVMLHEQADYTEMLRLKGYTEEVVEKLRTHAGNVLDVAYELRDIVNERQPELARYYETVYGMPFPAVENYFRAMFDALPTFEAQDLMEGYGAGTAAGSGKEAVLRSRSASVNRRLDLSLDVFSMFNLVMKEQSVILNYGSIGRDLTAILNYRDGKLNYHDALERLLDKGGVAAKSLTQAVKQAERARDEAREMVDDVRVAVKTGRELSERTYNAVADMLERHAKETQKVVTRGVVFCAGIAVLELVPLLVLLWATL